MRKPLVHRWILLVALFAPTMSPAQQAPQPRQLSADDLAKIRSNMEVRKVRAAQAAAEAEARAAQAAAEAEAQREVEEAEKAARLEAEREQARLARDEAQQSNDSTVAYDFSDAIRNLKRGGAELNRLGNQQINAMRQLAEQQRNAEAQQAVEADERRAAQAEQQRQAAQARLQESQQRVAAARERAAALQQAPQQPRQQPQANTSTQQPAKQQTIQERARQAATAARQSEPRSTDASTTARAAASRPVTTWPYRLTFNSTRALTNRDEASARREVQAQRARWETRATMESTPDSLGISKHKSWRVTKAEPVACSTNTAYDGSQVTNCRQRVDYAITSAESAPKDIVRDSLD